MHSRREVFSNTSCPPDRLVEPGFRPDLFILTEAASKVCADAKESIVASRFVYAIALAIVPMRNADCHLGSQAPLPRGRGSVFSRSEPRPRGSGASCARDSP